MNRSRQSMFSKLRKSMSKAIKNARNTFLSTESRKDSESLTAKELRKKFPKKISRKKEGLAKALKRQEARGSRAKIAKVGPRRSKRTTPGSVDVQPLGFSHKDSSRFIKNSNKKIKDQRVIAAHHGVSRK